MADHYIPFANSATDWGPVASIYPEAAGCRTTLQLIQKTTSRPPVSSKIWIDAGVDGLHWSKVNDPSDKTNPSYRRYISQFCHYGRISDPEYQRKPSKDEIGEFVAAVLNAVINAVANPSWISVPQLPYPHGADRNKINRLMAEATLQWKTTTRYRGRLMLPVILAKPGQTDRKTDRNSKVDLAFECFEASGASGLWVVDSTLDDLDGVATFENIRFPGIIKFHEELNSKLPSETVTVAGPYWGLNLVLWARGLIRFPAIGVGRSFRYYIAGGRQMEGSPRVALAPLRRLVVWSPELKTWLEQALHALSKSDPAHDDFAGVLRNFQLLNAKEYARRQVAEFYKKWLQRFEAVPASSRALTLYQDFSSAFVLGKKLKQPLPREEKVRNPARIAEQFMVNCL